MNPSLSRDVDLCVIDTNVALDLWLFDEPGVAALKGALEAGEIRALAVPEMRDELSHVLHRGALRGLWLQRRRAAEVLAAWDAGVACLQADLDALGMRPLCTDADDQKFIDLALVSKAAWLFTRDRAVLKLTRRLLSHGLRVAVPEKWQHASARQGF